MRKNITSIFVLAFILIFLGSPAANSETDLGSSVGEPIDLELQQSVEQLVKADHHASPKLNRASSLALSGGLITSGFSLRWPLWLRFGRFLRRGAYLKLIKIGALGGASGVWALRHFRDANLTLSQQAPKHLTLPSSALESEILHLSHQPTFSHDLTTQTPQEASQKESGGGPQRFFFLPASKDQEWEAAKKSFPYQVTTPTKVHSRIFTDIKKLYPLYQKLSDDEFLQRLSSHLPNLSVEDFNKIKSRDELLISIGEYFSSKKKYLQSPEHFGLREQYVFLARIMSLSENLSYRSIAEHMGSNAANMHRVVRTVISFLESTLSSSRQTLEKPQPLKPRRLFFIPSLEVSNKTDLQEKFPYDLEEISDADIKFYHLIKELYLLYKKMPEDQFLSRIKNYIEVGSESHLQDPDFILERIGYEFASRKKSYKSPTLLALRAQYVFLALMMALSENPYHSAVARDLKTSMGTTSRIITDIKIMIEKMRSSSTSDDLIKQEKLSKERALLQELNRLEESYFSMSKKEFTARLRDEVPSEILSDISPRDLLSYIKKISRQKKSQDLRVHIFLARILGLSPTKQTEISNMHSQKTASEVQKIEPQLREDLHHIDITYKIVLAQSLEPYLFHSEKILFSLPLSKKRQLALRFDVGPDHYFELFDVFKEIISLYRNQNDQYRLALFYKYILELDHYSIKDVWQMFLERSQGPGKEYEHWNHVVHDVLIMTDHLPKTFQNFETLYEYQKEMIQRLSKSEWEESTLQYRNLDISILTLDKKLEHFLDTHKHISEEKDISILYSALGIPSINQDHLSELMDMSADELKSKSEAMHKLWSEKYGIYSIHPVSFDSLEKRFFSLSPEVLEGIRVSIFGSEVPPQLFPSRLKYFYSTLKTTVQRHVFLAIILKLEQPSRHLFYYLGSLYFSPKKIKELNALSEVGAIKVHQIKPLIHIFIKNMKAFDVKRKISVVRNTDELSFSLQKSYEDLLLTDLTKISKEWGMGGGKFREKLASFVALLYREHPYMWALFLAQELNLEPLSSDQIKDLFALSDKNHELFKTNPSQIRARLRARFKAHKPHLQPRSVAQVLPQAVRNPNKSQFLSKIHSLWRQNPSQIIAQKLFIDAGDHVEMMSQIKGLLQGYKEHNQSLKVLMLYKYLFSLEKYSYSDLINITPSHNHHLPAKELYGEVRRDVAFSLDHLPKRFSDAAALYKYQKMMISHLSEEELLYSSRSHLYERLKVFSQDGVHDPKSKSILLASLGVPSISPKHHSELLEMKEYEFEEQKEKMVSLWNKTNLIHSVHPQSYETLRRRVQELSTEPLELIANKFFPKSSVSSDFLQKSIIKFIETWERDQRQGSGSDLHFFLSWVLGLDQPSRDLFSIFKNDHSNFSSLQNQRSSLSLRFTQWLEEEMRRESTVLQDSVTIDHNLIKVDWQRHLRGLYRKRVTTREYLEQLAQNYGYITGDEKVYFRAKLNIFIDFLYHRSHPQWGLFLLGVAEVIPDLSSESLGKVAEIWLEQEKTHLESRRVKEWWKRDLAVLKKTFQSYLAKTPYYKNAQELSDDLMIALSVFSRDEESYKNLMKEFKVSDVKADEFLENFKTCALTTIGSRRSAYVFYSDVLHLMKNYPRELAFDLFDFTEVSYRKFSSKLKASLYSCLHSEEVVGLDRQSQHLFAHDKEKEIYLFLENVWNHLDDLALKGQLREMSDPIRGSKIFSSSQVTSIKKDHIESFVSSLSVYDQVVFWALVLKIGDRNIMEIAHIYGLPVTDVAYKRNALKSQWLLHTKFMEMVSKPTTPGSSSDDQDARFGDEVLSKEFAQRFFIHESSVPQAMEALEALLKNYQKKSFTLKELIFYKWLFMPPSKNDPYHELTELVYSKDQKISQAHSEELVNSVIYDTFFALDFTAKHFTDAKSLYDEQKNMLERLAADERMILGPSKTDLFHSVRGFLTQLKTPHYPESKALFLASLGIPLISSDHLRDLLGYSQGQLTQEINKITKLWQDQSPIQNILPMSYAELKEHMSSLPSAKLYGWYRKSFKEPHLPEGEFFSKLGTFNKQLASKPRDHHLFLSLVLHLDQPSRHIISTLQSSHPQDQDSEELSLLWLQEKRKALWSRFHKHLHQRETSTSINSVAEARPSSLELGEDEFLRKAENLWLSDSSLLPLKKRFFIAPSVENSSLIIALQGLLKHYQKNSDTLLEMIFYKEVFSLQDYSHRDLRSLVYGKNTEKWNDVDLKKLVAKISDDIAARVDLFYKKFTHMGELKEYQSKMLRRLSTVERALINQDEELKLRGGDLSQRVEKFVETKDELSRLLLLASLGIPKISPHHIAELGSLNPRDPHHQIEVEEVSMKMEEIVELWQEQDLIHSIKPHSYAFLKERLYELTETELHTLSKVFSVTESDEFLDQILDFSESLETTNPHKAYLFLSLVLGLEQPSTWTLLTVDHPPLKWSQIKAMRKELFESFKKWLANE